MSGLHMLHSSWNYSDWRFGLEYRRWCLKDLSTPTKMMQDVGLHEHNWEKIYRKNYRRGGVFDCEIEKLIELVPFLRFYLLVFCNSPVQGCLQSCIRHKPVYFFPPNVYVAPGNSSGRLTLPELNGPIKYLHGYYVLLFGYWMDKWTFAPPLKIPPDHTGLQRNEIITRDILILIRPLLLIISAETEPQPGIRRQVIQ